jgi:hypothetical protein
VHLGVPKPQQAKESFQPSQNALLSRLKNDETYGKYAIGTEYAGEKVRGRVRGLNLFAIVVSDLLSASSA